MQTLLNLALIVIVTASCGASEPAAITIVSPRPYQVIQRRGFVPQLAHFNAVGGRSLGFADLDLMWNSEEKGTSFEYRLTLPSATDTSDIPWIAIPSPKAVEGGLATTIRIDAGGWYRLELRAVRQNETVAFGVVEPIGVGEVFLIAGQSYATNANEERLRVSDPAQRVVAMSAESKNWAVAHDPQPTPDKTDGGSLWPAFGDLVASVADVPVGLVNVAYGGTSSTQWMPAGERHARLVDAGKHLGRFRAILWQQGESDVIGAVPTTDYVQRLLTIRTEATKAWGFEPPWILAKSTLHPTVYNNPVGEDHIRVAIDDLATRPGFRLGPDTDILGGENRGPRNSRHHFSSLGQNRAALLWFASAWEEINRPRPRHEALLRALPGLHLTEPVWLSPMIHRESSVLLKEEDQAAIARLAFPAAEIIAIRNAASGVSIALGPQVTVSEDRLSLLFADQTPVPVIHQKDLFPPKDAPNSYRHREGHPDQNLLYAPGVWFHDRNIEITYRRNDTSEQKAPFGTDRLPRTMERLRAHQPLRIGVSGDSISTGLDASLLSARAPYQPGFPELIAAQLTETWDGDITLINRAVAGWSITHGLEDLDELLAAEPDLIIVAYGMNDVGRRDPAWFGQQAIEFVRRVQMNRPEAEILFVSPMLGNREWVHTPRDMFALYRDQLATLAGAGVELADVTAAWERLMRNKHDLDMTGNGLNHPNDFGHRVYAQVILQKLLPPAVAPEK